MRESSRAVLVAGSAGWDNCRHQADICHAYQVVHTNGILDVHIVVMMSDEIAHHIEYEENSFLSCVEIRQRVLLSSI